MAKHSKDEIMKEMIKLGKSIANQATPSNYPHEKAYQAKEFQRMLGPMRQLVRYYQDRGDIPGTLRYVDKLKKFIRTGIERNVLRKIETMLKNSK